jgi:hypothetical protein
VLNPLGYKLSSTGTLNFCEVLAKGQPYTSTAAAGAERTPMTLAHTWWLMNPNTRSFISAYYDAASGQLREMTLPQCIEVWGLHSRPTSAKGSSSATSSSGGCNSGSGNSGSSSGVQGRGRGRTGGSHKSVQKGDYKEGDWSHSSTSKECKQQQQQQQQHDQVFVNGEMLTLPTVPPKFAAFVAARARIFREISR